MSSALLCRSFVVLRARPKVFSFGLVPGLWLTIEIIAGVGMAAKSGFPGDVEEVEWLDDVVNPRSSTAHGEVATSADRRFLEESA